MKVGLPAILAIVVAATVGFSARPYLPGASVDDSSKGMDRAGDAKPKTALVAITAEQIAAQSITTAPLAVGSLDRHIAVPGTIVPDAARVARVPARVVGTVSEMRQLLGDDVKANDVVAVLDSREVAEAKSDYLGGRVQAELQRIAFNRQQKLLDIKAIATAQLDQTRATFQDAQLRVDLARQKLSALGLNAAEVADASKRDEATPDRSSLRRYELRAPISGRIVERKVDIGAAVGKESEPADVYTIADLSVLWVDIAVPTSQIASVKEGAKVDIVTDGDGPRRGSARVIFVSPLLNQDTRTARVVAALDNPGLDWRPGTFVNAEIAIAPGGPKLLVPRTAVQTIDGKTRIFAHVPKGFEARDVRLGASDDSSYEVLSGASAGEVVAVGNSFLLKAELGKADADSD